MKDPQVLSKNQTKTYTQQFGENTVFKESYHWICLVGRIVLL